MANAAGSGRGKSITPAAPGTATGSLQLGKQRFPLRHAFAVREADALAGDQERLAVLLTDEPVPETLRNASGDWRRWADQQAGTDALHGLILAIDPATLAWTHGQLLTRDGMLHYTEEASPPGTGRLRFTLAGELGAEVIATATMTESLPTLDDAVRWTATAEFRCAVVARPAISAEFTGKAALASPQFQAVQAFLAACKKQDLAGILESVDPASREAMGSMFAANRTEALQMFAGMAAECAKLKLGKIVVRDSAAEVSFLGPADSTTVQTLRVVFAGGAWKLAQ